MNKNKGFTLIELLIVISIVAMLSSIILNYLGSARNKGNDTQKIQSLKQVLIAINLYYQDNGYYAADTTALTTAAVKNGNRPYIISVPTSIIYNGLTDSTGGNCSATPTTCSYYHIAIPLSENTNRILVNDANIKQLTGDAVVNGKSDDCIGPDTNPPPGKCYDITPDHQ